MVSYLQNLNATAAAAGSTPVHFFLDPSKITCFELDVPNGMVERAILASGTIGTCRAYGYTKWEIPKISVYAPFYGDVAFAAWGYPDDWSVKAPVTVMHAPSAPVAVMGGATDLHAKVTDDVYQRYMKMKAVDTTVASATTSKFVGNYMDL